MDAVAAIGRVESRGAWTTVENGRPEDADQGIDTSGRDAGQADIAPTSPARQPAQQPRTGSGSTDSRTSGPPTQSGTSRPSTTSVSRPRIPTAATKPPVIPPSAPNPVPTVQTAVGKITGVAGSTAAELQHAVGYCQQRMLDNLIPVTQSRLQSCSYAYLTVGAIAADAVIRNLLSQLGLRSVS